MSEVDVNVGVMVLVDNEVLVVVVSKYDCLYRIHDASFLILFFLAVLWFGPAMPWGVVPELPELGDELAADEWLGEELAVEGANDFELVVEGVDGFFSMDFEEFTVGEHISFPPLLALGT